jgi:hypothetical protein
MERHQQISDLYHAALARAPEERRAFLTDACDGDGALRQEVDSRLFQRRSTSFRHQLHRLVYR